MIDSSIIRTWVSQRHRKILIVLAAMIPLIIAGLGWSYFALNDDGAVLSLLRSGDARTLIMSYPMSYLLVVLYKFSPLIPWYSFYVLIMLSLATALMTYVVVGNKSTDVVQKALLLSYVLYFSIYYSNNINYTSTATLLFVSVHMLALNMNSVVSKVMIVFLIPLVLLTRCNDILFILLTFSALPLILNGSSLKNYILRTLLFVCIAIAAFVLSRYPQDSDYVTYTKFNSARSAHNDLNYPMNIPGIDADDKSLFNSFFPYDEELFPTKHLLENAPGTKSLIIHRLSNTSIDQIKEIISRHFLEFIIILSSLLYSIYRNSFYKKTLFITVIQLAMCIALFAIRDVDRLSNGILFLILSTIHLSPNDLECSGKLLERIKVDKHLDKNNKNYFDITVTAIRPHVVILVALMLLMSFCQALKFAHATKNWINSSFILRPRESRQIKENMQKNSELKGMLLLPDLISSPTLCFTFCLGREDLMLGYSYEGWLPAGWLARSPIYYKTLGSQGAETFSDLFRNGKLGIVYKDKITSKDPWSEYARSKARVMYADFFNKHYALPGCAFESNTVYRDKFVTVETYQLNCN